MTSFLKIAQQFFVCEYFLRIPIDVPSFKLIEGQIKELQGMVSNTPRAENIFLLTGLRIYTGEYKAQGPTLCPTEGRALRGARALYSPV